MKHTDVLLKIQDANDDVQEQAVDKAKFLNQLQSKMRVVHEFSKSPGWSLFTEELVAERGKLLRLLETVGDATRLAKLTGTLLAVESFIDWPNYVAKELDAQAKDISKPE